MYYKHIKEAMTRSALLRKFLQGATGVAAMKALPVLKNQTKQVATQLADKSNKIVNKVKGVEPIPLAIKGKINLDLLNSFQNNTASSRRSFLKNRTLDTLFGQTPWGKVNQTVIPLAPSLAPKLMQNVGGMVIR